MPHHPPSILAFTSSAGLQAAEAPEVIFVRRLLPLFSERGLACHGKDEAKIKSGYDMRTAAKAFEGGDSGKPPIVRGKPVPMQIVAMPFLPHRYFRG